jgi:hypothetical protein
LKDTYRSSAVGGRRPLLDECREEEEEEEEEARLELLEGGSVVSKINSNLRS